MRIALSSLLLFACGSEPELKPTPSIVVDQTSLRTAIGATDVSVSGVTIDPYNHKRYVLEANAIYELADDGARRTVWLGEVQGTEGRTFTDFASLGFGQFAIVAMNDGFKLDVDLKLLNRYFCYLPGEIVDDPNYEVPVQLTESLTYDHDSELMFAQPQTFEGSVENDPQLSQIGQFTLSGGEGFGWLEIDDEDFIAGGIAKTSATEMTLGSESKLYTFDMRTSTMNTKIDLKELGIEKIDAMTRDPVSGNLLIVDGASDDLFEIDLP